MSNYINTPFKIVITGAESCGKTTLANDLALHFDIPYVPEYAREYLEEIEKKNRKYDFEDLTRIAQGQISTENKLTTALKNHKNQILICDTDLLTLKIWAEEKFGRCDAFILENIAQRHYDLYVLMSPEGIVWEYDPQRENPHDRPRLTAIYEENLKLYHKNYVVLRGGREARLEAILKHINYYLSNRNEYGRI